MQVYLHIYNTGKIRPFLKTLLPFFRIRKNGFWPVIPLLITKCNFTDMLNVKGYIWYLRTVALIFPVCELSALDGSECDETRSLIVKEWAP